MPKLIKRPVILNPHANSSRDWGTWWLFQFHCAHSHPSGLADVPPCTAKQILAQKYMLSCILLCHRADQRCPCTAWQVCVHHTNIPNSAPSSTPSRAPQCLASKTARSTWESRATPTQDTAGIVWPLTAFQGRRNMGFVPKFHLNTEESFNFFFNLSFLPCFSI